MLLCYHIRDILILHTEDPGGGLVGCPEGGSVLTALILLPLKYNPDEFGDRRPVEKEKFRAAGIELAELFGGAILDENPKGGFWWNQGCIEEDDIVVFEVNMSGEPEENLTRLQRYAESVLLDRFRQEEIWIRIIPNIRILEVQTIQIRREGG
jgi:hypothetical protein